MCLSNVGEKLVATEDIKCYKVLNYAKVPTEFGLTCHGKKAKAIFGNQAYYVIISIYKNDIYLCSDNRLLNGEECPKKFGKTYSWIVDNATTSVLCKKNELLCDGYRTPYQSAIVRIGETYTSELKCEDRFGEGYEVYIGLHSYVNIPSIIISHREVLVECIIPKGASYYVGKFVSDSYASDTLTYVKLI